jgi:SAM-dependent methyltransferase
VAEEERAPIVELAEWFDTAPGQYVLRWELAQFDAVLADVFGYHALQVGFPELDLLRANRMPFKAYVGSEMPSAQDAARWQACTVAYPEALPFESQSIDLLVLPHAFECTDAPHEILREVERVLVPEGRVVISGFNPWSLWGVRNRMPGMEPWLPHAPSAQVSLARVKDWLKLLSFEVDRGRFGCYAPASRSEKWLNRWSFMEAAGDRWWAVCGAVYTVSAVKRVAGMRLIGPAWKKSPRKAPARASVVANHRVGVGSGFARDE